MRLRDTAAVQFKLEERLEAPLEKVEAALIDPRFIAATAELPKVGGAELIEQSRDGDRVHQKIRYRFTGELSSAVTAVVDRDKLSWVDESDHDLAAHTSEHRIVPDNYGDRLEASYTTRLEPDGDHGTRRVAEGTIKVRMMLVGGRVERAIVSGLEEHAVAEAKLLDDWVTRGA